MSQVTIAVLERKETKIRGEQMNTMILFTIIAEWILMVGIAVAGVYLVKMIKDIEENYVRKNDIALDIEKHLQESEAESDNDNRSEAGSDNDNR